MPLLNFLGISPMPKKPTSRLVAAPQGWTITPRTLGRLFTACGLIALLWKPVEWGMQLNTSLDKLATAVTQLQTVIKEQGEDVGTLKSKMAATEASVTALQRQTQTLETQVQGLQQQRR
jgi:hypothetical protein